MKFLVTGSTGLIGQNVVADLVSQNHEVYSSYYSNKPKNGIPIQMDLANLENTKKVIQKIAPDNVIHLAAMTNVDLCEREKELAYLTNVKSTELLAQESSKISAFFVYVSTDYVFDGQKGMNKEEDTPNPLGYYGRTKLEGEKTLNNLASSWAITRTSTPFGIHPKKKSFPLWIKENLESKKEIPILVDQFTSPTYVPNLSKMLTEVATRQITGIIHLAGATRISRYALAELIAEKLGLEKKLLIPSSTDQMDWTAQRPKDSSLDVSRAFEILSEKPQKIEESLELFFSEL